MRFLLVVCHFVCPLLFFTDLTRNPYFTQIVLLNASLMGAALWSAAGGLRGSLRLPRTPLDAPLLAGLGVGLFSWGWAWARHAPFYRDPVQAEGLRVAAFGVVNVLIPYYLGAALTRERPAQSPVPLGPWVAFVLAWGGLWLLFPALRGAAAAPLRIWPHLWDPYGALLWAAGLAVAFRLTRPGTMHHYWHLALAVGFWSAVYGVCQYFNTEFIWPKVLNPYGGRAVSTFGNPNFMSSYQVLLVPVAAAYYLNAGTRGARAVYAVVFLALEACLLSSLTRSSWVGAAVALAALFLSPSIRRAARQNLESHGVVAALAVALVLFWPQSTVAGSTPTVFGRLSELSQILEPPAQAPYSPLYQRLLIWACAWMMGAENPLWGKGMGQFELFYPFYQGFLLDAFPLFRSLRTHANNAHNEVLEVWAQTGLLGLGILAWTWTTFAAAVRRWGSEDARPRGPWEAAAAAGVAGMLADNLLNVSLHFAVPAFLFWWQAGVAMSRGCDRQEGWRDIHLKNRYSSLAATALVMAFAASGTWWWARQWSREARYFIGFKLLRGGQVLPATRMLEAAHSWHGRDVNTNYELGNAYARGENYERAAWAYREALKANAGYDEIYFNLGTILAQRLGRVDEGLAYYKVSNWINPLSLDVINNMTAFYLSQPKGYAKECASLLERAARLFPENPNFHGNLGQLYRLGGEPEKAAREFEAALRLSPELASAEAGLEEVRRGTGRGGEVLAALKAYRDLDARIARRDYSTVTLEAARRAAAAFPASPKARFYLGNLELMHGRPDAAVRLLEPLAGGDPGNAALWRNLGEAYLRLGRRDAAAAAFRKVLSSSPEDAHARGRLNELGTP